MAEFAIEASGLRKFYGDVCALDGIDLSASAGTVLGLLGPNGAGKTTAVRILTTLLRPDGGSARVAGLDVEREGAELRTRIGLAGQYAAVDENLTGAENLEMVDRFRSLPMSRAAVLAGRTLADIGTNTISIGIMIGVGALAGFSFDAPVSHIFAGILLLLLFGYAFSWVFAFIGLSSSSPEASQSLGFILIFPLTFVSSAFVPVASMPSALQAFAEVNPFTITVNAMRALFLGAPAGNDVWGAVAWSIGIAAVFATLSVARYKRAVTR